jgi:hypothetical protein
MSLSGSSVGLSFTGGDYNSSNKDANGFWLDVGSISYDTSIGMNSTTIDITSLTLRHTFTGTQFSGFTLYVYLRAEFRLNGVLTYKYLFGDSGGDSVGTKSMSGGSTSLLAASDIDPVEIPHNSDGSRPDVVIRGYCDSTSSESYVPASTTANSSSIAFDQIPKGKRFESENVKYLSNHLRFDGTNWVNTNTRYRYDGTHWKSIE